MLPIWTRSLSFSSSASMGAMYSAGRASPDASVTLPSSALADESCARLKTSRSSGTQIGLPTRAAVLRERAMPATAGMIGLGLDLTDLDAPSVFKVAARAANVTTGGTGGAPAGATAGLEGNLVI